jgi:succinyl-diaminopimelate desuccinylase
MVRLNPREAVELAAELVRLDTTNPPGGEAAAIAVLEERLRLAGFEVARVPYLAADDGPEQEGKRAHAVARLRGTGQRPGLLFSGHVDVVPVGEVPWSVDPFGGEIRGAELFGRGSCDMKGGVAALVVAAEALSAACRERGEPPEGDLVVALTADEERNCLGAEALVEEPLFAGLGAALVAEPTALQLYVAEKGAFWVEATFFGRTAHGSMPHLGANAVAAAADFVLRWERRYRTDHPVHPLLGTPTLNIGVIAGGVKVNVVPDRCTVQLDMRTVPPLTHETLSGHLQETLAEVASLRPGTRAEYRITSNRPPISCPADSPLFLALAEAATELAGVDPTPRGVPYCTEACIWTPRLEIPSVICGPGEPGMAHQPDERVAVAQLEQAARIYTRAAATLLL